MQERGWGHKGWGWGGMNGEKVVKGGLKTSEATKEQRSLRAKAKRGPAWVRGAGTGTE